MNTQPENKQFPTQPIAILFRFMNGAKLFLLLRVRVRVGVRHTK